MSSKLDGMCDVDICTDCLMMIANGEIEDADVARNQQVAEEIARIWDGYHLVPGSLNHGPDNHPTDDDCPCSESWFSWSDCEGCGSTLGGDRHHAVAIPN